MDGKLANGRHGFLCHAMYRFNDPGTPRGTDVGSDVLTYTSHGEFNLPYQKMDVQFSLKGKNTYFNNSHLLQQVRINPFPYLQRNKLLAV